METYTVKKLAQIAGVSVRTLHYYDEIGLLVPFKVGENGYRYYGQNEVEKLQQILFFRELEFELDQIKTIVTTPGFDSLQALKDQKRLLELKKKRVGKLIKLVNSTIRLKEKGEIMTNKQAFSAFDDKTYQEHKDEVEKRWGKTRAYKQSMERVSKMSKEELERVKAEGEEIADKVAELLKADKRANSSEVQEQMKKFWKHLHNFYDPTPEMFAGLGQMYVSDERFRKYYEKRAKGLAGFMKEAMEEFAKNATKIK